MIEYKTCRFIDGKLRWIIVDGHRKIINEYPNKEELKSVTKWNFKHNDTNTCDRCGINFDIAIGHPYREYNKEGNWTGKWDCPNCWQKYDSFSGNNIIKSLRDRRTGNQDPNSNNAKGDNFEELTCRWRSTISTIPVEDLNKKLDNYTIPIDHSRDSELGIIQTKGKFYDSYNRYWLITGIEREWGKEFDNMICYCASKDGNMIERLYIFPKEEIEDITGISIYKNPSRCEPWYEKYRVKDEETLELLNKIWKDIIDKR